MGETLDKWINSSRLECTTVMNALMKKKMGVGGRSAEKAPLPVAEPGREEGCHAEFWGGQGSTM